MARVVANEPASVSRTPPTAYETMVKPHLTKLEDARALPKVPTGEKDASTESVLEELIGYVEDSGKALLVSHTIRAVLTEPGVRTLAEGGRIFSVNLEKPHLVEARTIRADGTIVLVEPKGIMLKRAEQSAISMHSDKEEVRIVFPEVVPGAMVEDIFVREIFEPVIPGEFTLSRLWGSEDGLRRERVALNLSEAMAARLLANGLGFALPAMSRTALPDGRVLIEWRGDLQAPVKRESGSMSLSRTGPALQLSTLPDWESFGRWYAGLLRERDEATTVVRERAREWSAGKKSHREIATALFEKVSRDVRYTGLEFGRGALQPRSPDEVLANKYGDCKDKANLLRLLLREHGIESRIVLLDTRAVGNVSRTTVTPVRFNHAILAVQLPGEGEIYCDPTIEGGWLGLLGVGSSDTDAMLVSLEGKVEWVHLPAQPLGKDRLTVDLELEPGGGISGWLTRQCDGYLGVGASESLKNRERAAACDYLAEELMFGITKVKVIDYEAKRIARPDGSYESHVKMYVVRTGAALRQGESSMERVIFPGTPGLMPIVGDTPERQNPSLSLLVESEVSGRIRFPKGAKVMDAPPPFQRKTPAFRVNLNWQAKADSLEVQGSAAGLKFLVPAREYRDLWQISRDLSGWIGNNVLVRFPAANSASQARTSPPRAIGGSGEEPAAARPWTPAPDRLPKMFSAEGQLALIEKRFPFNSHRPETMDHASRRIAYQGMLKHFPDNPTAQVQAGICALLSDLMEGKVDGLSERMRAVLEKHEKEVPLSVTSGARIILGTALLAQEKFNEVCDLTRPMVDDSSLELKVRQAAAMLLGSALSDKTPGAAIPYLRQALETSFLPDQALEEVGAVFLACLAKAPEISANDIVRSWAELDQRFTSFHELLREGVCEIPEAMVDIGRIDAAEKSATALAEIGKGAKFTEDDRTSIAEIPAKLGALRAMEPPSSLVKEWLKAKPWPDLEKLEEGHKAKSASEYGYLAEDSEDPEISLRYELQSLLAFGPQDDFVDRISSIILECQEWQTLLLEKRRKSPKPKGDLEGLLDVLLQAWAEVPDEDERGTGLIWRGKIIRRRENKAAELAYYRSISSDEKQPAAFRVKAHLAAADTLAEDKDWKGVLAEWTALDAWPENSETTEALVRSAYLNLSVGDRAGAWARFQKLAALDAEALAEVEESLPDRVTKLLGAREESEEWWQRSDRWWKEWLALRRKVTDAPKFDEDGHPWHIHGLSLDALKKLAPAQRRQELWRVAESALVQARWHQSDAPRAIEILRKEAVKVSARQTAEIRHLADAIEAATKPQ